MGIPPPQVFDRGAGPEPTALLGMSLTWYVPSIALKKRWGEIRLHGIFAVRACFSALSPSLFSARCRRGR